LCQNCDEEGIVVYSFEHFADDAIAGLVHLFDLGAKAGGLVGLVAGVVLIAKTPEHVLHAVGRVEEDEEKAFGAAVELGEHHLLALVEDAVGLVEEGGFVDALVFKAGMVLCHAERGVGTDHLLEFLRVDGRGGDGKEGIIGIEVDRRDVERKVGGDVRNMEADLAADDLECRHLELDLDPGAPTAFGYFYRGRTGDLETDLAGG
jgi:hypothetical protein